MTVNAAIAGLVVTLMLPQFFTGLFANVVPPVTIIEVPTTPAHTVETEPPATTVAPAPVATTISPTWTAATSLFPPSSTAVDQTGPVRSNTTAPFDTRGGVPEPTLGADKTASVESQVNTTFNQGDFTQASSEQKEGLSLSILTLLGVFLVVVVTFVFPMLWRARIDPQPVSRTGFKANDFDGDGR